MNVCYATDNNYIMQATVSITSLLKNNAKHQICIYVLDNGISDSNKANLTMHVQKYHQKITFCNVSEKIESLIKGNVNAYGDYGSYSAYSRLFVRELLPEDVNRVLYIDCDTIVNSDIYELYEYNLKGKTLGAVRDITNCKYNITIGLKPSDLYFNTGVLLIDLIEWENKQYLKKIIEYISNRKGKYQNADQDIINVILQDDICTLDPKYNHIIPIDTLGWKHLCYMLDKTENTYYKKEVSREAAANPVIIHYTYFFTGRPWFSNSKNGKNDILWLQYLKATPWKNYIRKKQKFRFVEKCQRITLGNKILPQIVIALIYKSLIYIRLNPRIKRK